MVLLRVVFRDLRPGVQSQRRARQRAGGTEESKTGKREGGLPNHRCQGDKDIAAVESQEYRQSPGDCHG